MPEVFTWNPSLNFTKSTKPSLLSSMLGGSNLSIRKSTGINNLEIEWDLQFLNKSIEESNEIIDFFKRHDGRISFYFTPPGELTQYRVIAQDWSVTYGSHISRTINTKFFKVNDID